MCLASLVITIARVFASSRCSDQQHTKVMKNWYLKYGYRAEWLGYMYILMLRLWIFILFLYKWINLSCMSTWTFLFFRWKYLVWQNFLSSLKAVQNSKMCRKKIDMGFFFFFSLLLWTFFPPESEYLKIKKRSPYLLKIFFLYLVLKQYI